MENIINNEKLVQNNSNQLKNETTKCGCGSGKNYDECCGKENTKEEFDKQNPLIRHNELEQLRMENESLNRKITLLKSGFKVDDNFSLKVTLPFDCELTNEDSDYYYFTITNDKLEFCVSDFEIDKEELLNNILMDTHSSKDLDLEQLLDENIKSMLGEYLTLY